MQIYQTNLMQNNTLRKPSQLDYRRILRKRSLSRSKSEDFYTENLETGERGERILLDYIQKYGKEDWIVIRNIWLNYSGPFECDLILITKYKIYIFEVKNYTGKFTYENGVCKINDIERKSNCIEQTRSTTVGARNICHSLSSKMKIQGALVFVGVDNRIEIKSDVNNIEIVPRNELQHYIEKIVEEETKMTGQTINPKQVIRQFERYEINDYFLPKPIQADGMMNLQKGIYCLNCGNFDIAIKRKNIECVCGVTENRETAVLRTICEYGVLNHDKHLTMGELMEFLNNQVSPSNLRKLLTKYFGMIKKQRYTYYNNWKLPIYKLYEELNLSSTVNYAVDHAAYTFDLLYPQFRNRI